VNVRASSLHIIKTIFFNQEIAKNPDIFEKTLLKTTIIVMYELLLSSTHAANFNK